jgi:hypothetical protein
MGSANFTGGHQRTKNHFVFVGCFALVGLNAPVVLPLFFLVNPKNNVGVSYVDCQ